MHFVSILLRNVLHVIHIIHALVYIGLIRNEPALLVYYKRYIKLIIGLLFFFLFNPVKRLRGFLHRYIDKVLIQELTFTCSIILLTTFTIDTYYAS